MLKKSLLTGTKTRETRPIIQILTALIYVLIFVLIFGLMVILCFHFMNSIINNFDTGKIWFFIIIPGTVIAALTGIILFKVILRIITVKDEKKRKLDEEKEQVIMANSIKSGFLANVSHEIRTPMNAILGITEIQLQSGKLSSNTAEAFEIIYDSGYLLLNIINDILDLSKIEAGRLELVPVKYNAASLINDIIHLNVMRCNSKSFEFKLNVDQNIPLSLFGDELRIKQIMNNLLSNAFKYTESGEVLLSVTAEYAQQTDRDTVRQAVLVFSVHDTGQGMTAEQLEKLFEKYARFNIEVNRTIEGTGLGMTITRHLVQMMNGDIFVESEPGKGSVFTVRLPQEFIGNDVLGRELAEKLEMFRLGRVSQSKKAPQIIREYMPYGRILIVDDVETNLYVARGLLAPYGLSTETAASGIEAIEKIKNGASYDIIFMDHFMPKLDGMETVRIIRELDYTHPVIALTANAMAGQEEIFLANGFEGFISKPIDIRQLNTTLNKFVRDKYPPEVVEAARRLKDNYRKNTSSYPQTFVDQQVLEFFLRDAEKAVVTLKVISRNNFRRNDDIRMYVITVHAIKAALANIGEDELSAVALKLEQAGKDGNVDIMISDTPDFLESLRLIIEKKKNEKDMAGFTNEIPEKAPENLSDYLNEKLLIIQAACGRYDNKTAEDTLAELLPQTWSQQTRDLLNNTGEHLLHSEFEEAAKIITEYFKGN